MRQFLWIPYLQSCLGSRLKYRYWHVKNSLKSGLKSGQITGKHSYLANLDERPEAGSQHTFSLKVPRKRIHKLYELQALKQYFLFLLSIGERAGKWQIFFPCTKAILLNLSGLTKSPQGLLTHSWLQKVNPWQTLPKSRQNCAQTQ